MISERHAISKTVKSDDTENSNTLVAKDESLLNGERQRRLSAFALHNTSPSHVDNKEIAKILIAVV